MKSVYKIPQKIKCLTDERKRKSIPLFNIVMPVLLFLMLQYESFHTIFSAPESMSKRLKNCLSRKKHTGETEYFYRSVVCMIIGKSPHVILGQEMLKPRDLSGFEMEGCPYKLRVVRYHEQWEENGKETERFMWLVTTLEAADYRVLWEMMHRRWDIEENGFHQLKTYYHAKHCYCRDAVETIFNLIIIGFNVRELYLYRRSRNFAGSGISRKSINRIFCDDLLTEKVKQILCEKGG